MLEEKLIDAQAPVGETRDLDLRPHPDAAVYFDAWVRAYSAPAMLVTLDLAVLWTNGAAVTMLEGGEPFTLTGGRVVCTDKTQAADLRAFLLGLDREPRVWIYRTLDGQSLLVRGEAVHPAGAAPGAALMIYPAGASIRYVWGDFGQVFGLTRAEVSIVKRVIGGERADVMAEDLGIAVETVRTHIRRTYNKLSINSREQLFSLISPFRIR
jgi:DNA-binding CsgD family transcriptional regulator